MMTAHELLVQARDRISDPKNWAGNAVDLELGRSCAYTATYCGHTDEDMKHEIDQQTRKEALKTLAIADGWQGYYYGGFTRLAKRLVEFNDSHTHEEVLELFDQAIEVTS